MDVPLNDVVYLDFITSRFDTGAVTDADSTPTFEVFENSTDTDIGVGGNATKRSAKTGDYRASFTASAANGFEAGKYYNVIGSATVNSVAGKGVIGTFRCVAAVPALASDIPSAASNADAVWDELRSGHTTVGSFGQSSQAVRSNTAQDGSMGTITLDASASAVDDFYNGLWVAIVAGTGAGQIREITDYVGATKVASVTPNWTAPDNTSVFAIF